VAGGAGAVEGWRGLSEVPDVAVSGESAPVFPEDTQWCCAAAGIPLARYRLPYMEHTKSSADGASQVGDKIDYVKVIDGLDNLQKPAKGATPYAAKVRDD